MQVIIATVNGGETTCLIGTFTSMELVTAAVDAHRKESGFTADDGYSITGLIVDDEDKRIAYMGVYETGEDSENRTLVYTFTATNLNEPIDQEKPIEMA